MQTQQVTAKRPGGQFKPIKERLEKNSTRVPFSGCQLWVGPSVPKGYGVISYNGKQRYAHRVSWTLANGPIPEGKFVLHECDTPACINPNHLFIGTLMDNVVDMDRKGRRISCPGESSWNAKLTEEQVLYIRKTYIPYDRFFGGGALSRMLGVNPNVVTEIAAKRKWTHV